MGVYYQHWLSIMILSGLIWWNGMHDVLSSVDCSLESPCRTETDPSTHSPVYFWRNKLWNFWSSGDLPATPSSRPSLQDLENTALGARLKFFNELESLAKNRLIRINMKLRMDIASLLQTYNRLHHHAKTFLIGYPALDRTQDVIVQMAHDRQGLVAGTEATLGEDSLIWNLAGSFNLDERLLALIRITEEFELVEIKLQGVSSTLRVPGIKKLHPELAEAVKLLIEYQTAQEALRLMRLK